MKILHLLPTLQYSGAAKQVVQLAPPLVRAGHDVLVCCLGLDGPWGQRLRGQGVTVQPLAWTRGFDPTPLWKLHRLLQYVQPDVIHVWHASTLRTLGLVGKKWLPRAVVSRALGANQRSRLDRWLLKRVGRIVVSGAWEQNHCQELGLAPGKITLVRPGIERWSMTPGPTLAVPAGPRIACIGPLETHKGIRDAIWTLDMIAFVFGDLQLIVAGTGPDEPRLRRFAGHTPHANNIHFIGPVADSTGILAQADLCWIPNLANGGATVALEAQAASCPVIASDVPALRMVVKDGLTGLLVPPGDKVALGRATRTLLLDESWRRRLARAAQVQVEDDFPMAAVVEGCGEIYRQVRPLAA